MIPVLVDLFSRTAQTTYHLFLGFKLFVALALQSLTNRSPIESEYLNLVRSGCIRQNRSVQTPKGFAQKFLRVSYQLRPIARTMFPRTSFLRRIAFMWAAQICGPLINPDGGGRAIRTGAVRMPSPRHSAPGSNYESVCIPGRLLCSDLGANCFYHLIYPR